MVAPYPALYIVNVVLIVLSAMIAVIVKTSPDALGLNAVWLNWLVVVQAGLTALAALLPSVLKTPAAHAAQLTALGRKRASDK